MTLMFLAVPRPGYLGNLLEGDAWKNASLVERCVHVARSQERQKVRELKPNWGGMVTVYLNVAGWFTPAPWCAAFVYWCLVESGADKKRLWKNPASTWSLYMWAKATGRLGRVPGRGRAFVWNTGSETKPGSGHTGFCLSAANPTPTIEGNTDSKGSREGVMVAQKERPGNLLRRFPLWGYVDFGGVEV